MFFPLLTAPALSGRFFSLKNLTLYDKIHSRTNRIKAISGRKIRRNLLHDGGADGSGFGRVATVPPDRLISLSPLWTDYENWAIIHSKEGDLRIMRRINGVSEMCRKFTLLQPLIIVFPVLSHHQFIMVFTNFHENFFEYIK